MFKNLKADLEAARLHNASSKSWVDQNLTIWLHYGMQAVVCYRFGRWLHTFRVPFLKQLLKLVQVAWRTWCEMIYGINVPESTAIGPGFCIHTWAGVFLPHSTTIGSNFTVQHGNLIEDGVVIGDDVYCGVGAKLIGRIRIGNHVRIGANAVVITDIPDHSTAVGVPARIIRHAPAAVDTPFRAAAGDAR
jgi:serine O-acetyltransferase